MSVVISTHIALNDGRHRIWTEGRKLAQANIEIGMKFLVQIDNRARRAIIKIGNDLQDFTGTVSRRKVRGKEGTYLPVMDIPANNMVSLFSGIKNVRLAVKDCVIIVTAQVAFVETLERLARIKDKLVKKIPLGVASLFHGGGVLDHALHSGLARSGVSSFVQVAVELEAKYLETSMRNNPHLFTPNTVFFEGSVEFFRPHGVTADILVAGIPCTGASLSGRAKNNLEFAEDHSAAGDLFFYTLNTIIAMNPAIVIIENVEAYLNTASMSVIRSVLSRRGYALHEKILSGGEFGCLEDRRRMCLVAMTEGLSESFSLDALVSPKEKETSIAAILDDIPVDSPMYRSYDYLAAKEVRDAAAKKGFRRQLVTQDSTSVGCIGKGYAKARSTEPFLIHPCNPDLSRLFTVPEHARLKSIPESIIHDCEFTLGHEILGQSVNWTCFDAVGFAIGQDLLLNTQEIQIAA